MRQIIMTNPQITQMTQMEAYWKRICVTRAICA